MAIYGNAFNRYSIYPCRFGDMLFRDINDFGVRSGSNKSVVTPGGNLDPSAIVNCCADPILTFSTRDFTAAFGGSPAVGIRLGYPVNVNSGTAATLIQLQERVDGAAFWGGGTGTHIVGTNNKGFLYVSEISAQQDDTMGAKISLEYALMSTDGMIDPIGWSIVSALTSTPLSDGIWFLGPARMGTHGSATSAIQGVVSVSVRPGLAYRSPRADGAIFPQNGSLYSIVPEIRLRVLDPGALGSAGNAYPWLGSNNNDYPPAASPWGDDFKRNTSNNFLFYFQAGIHGGGRYASTSTVHFMVQASTGDDTTESISVSQVDDAMSEIVIRATGGISMTPNVAIN